MFSSEGAETTAETTIYTIPQSHFCELGRWALTLAKVPNVVDRPYITGIHMFFSPIQRLRGSVEGKKPSASTPLVVRSGEVLADDSWACLAMASDTSCRSHPT